MKLEMYSTQDSYNTINKDLSLIKEIEIRLKANIDLYNPSLIMTKQEFYNNVNYAKLLDRYYFVEIQNHPNNNFILLNLHEDVLQTYANDILNSSQDIVKKAAAGNIKQTNISPETISRYYDSDVKIEQGSSIIMVTSGQPIKNGELNHDDDRSN